MLTYLQVLEKFATYSDYDRDRRAFNLLSVSYELHKVCQTVEMILHEYDNSGMLGVIYAKRQFEKLLKECKLVVYDVVSNPDCYKDEKEMFELFNTSTVKDAEKGFISSLEDLYMKIVKHKLLGEDDSLPDKLFNSLEGVIESVNRCKVEIFKKGGNISNIDNISTQLHAYNTLAECLLDIENRPDGMYFCFIDAGHTADCFFCFLIKSNGTILSVGDRIDEAFIGQHGSARNGRWAEGKADSIFPYDYIFHYEGHDYKGYASKYIIDESKLDIYNLGPEVFMPVLIAMLLIVLKFKDYDVSDMSVKYLDSFLPSNRALIESNSLMVVSDSQLAVAHDSVNMFFDNNKILSGEYADEFDYNKNKHKHYSERGHFSNNNQMMVDMWADGFEFDPTELFTTSNVKCLVDSQKKDTDGYVPEFIGTESRLRLEAYRLAREQLAKYMEDRIYDAWIEGGKNEPIKEWFVQAIRNNSDFLCKMFLEEETAVQSGQKSKLGEGWHRTDCTTIHIWYDDTYPSGVSPTHIINCSRKEDIRWEYVCPITGNTANTWFVVSPRDYKELAMLTGLAVDDLPKLVKGWINDGHTRSGNHLLDATDAVEAVRTPFEHRNCFLTDRWNGAYHDFKFAFGFSKRGWNKLKKELGGK